MPRETVDRLESPERCELEKGQRRPGVKRPRAIVSVAFTREDFEQVACAAQRWGMKTSEFIREAAVRAVRGEALVEFAGWTEGKMPQLYGGRAPTIVTLVRGSVTSEKAEGVVSGSTWA